VEVVVLAIVMENLKVGYIIEDEVFWAVKGVDLVVEEGTTLCIIGESGCGKSTLASAITGILPPYALTDGKLKLFDHVVINGQLRNYNGIRGKITAYIPQNPGTSLNPFLTVEEHFYYVLRSNFKSDREFSKKIAMEILPKVNLDFSVLEKYPHELSGGMQQRVIIALALATNAQILVADEPTSFIDAHLRLQIIELLGRLQREFKKTLIVITHDLLTTSTICDYIAIMYAGKIMEVGPREKVLRNPRHPYTKMLLETTPILGVKKRLKPIPGEPPSLGKEYQACLFLDRCPYKSKECYSDPQIQVIENSHFSKCWKALEAPWL
jgi:oligopeptide/dipeptide ABC transporter ATP-binding protein